MTEGRTKQTLTSPLPFYGGGIKIIGIHCYSYISDGDRLNFIIDHRLESVDAFDAILPIIIGSHIFTELSLKKRYFLCLGRKFRSIWVFFRCPCHGVKGNN